MDRKNTLLRLVDLVHREETLLASRLTAQEIAYDGTPEHWSGRDMLAHCAAWKQHLAENLAHAQRGEPVDRDEDDQRANDRIFKKYHAWSLEQILAFGEQATSQLSGQIMALDEADLLNKDLLPQQAGREVWRGVVGTAFTHPVVHLTDFYVKRGDIAPAAALQEMAGRELGALDNSPAWLGNIRYNLACFYALAGQTPQAIQTLEEALHMAPELVEWSKQDPDFTAIRDEPDFQAVYSRLSTP